MHTTCSSRKQYREHDTELARPTSDLDSGGLGAGLEGVGQTTFSAVLTVLVEGHLSNKLNQNDIDI